MKNILLAVFTMCALVLVGCINSSTAWTNRSVTYQVTPENIGEHSSVSGSPTTNDASVNADKTFEHQTKANVAQSLADNSSNDQSKYNSKAAEPEKKEEAKPAEEEKK